MKLRNLSYAVFVAATAGAFVFGAGARDVAKADALPCALSAKTPVCGAKGGMKFTYANSCYAANDGAKVVASKACPAPKAKKAKKGGKKKMAKAKKPAKKKM